MHAFIDGTRQQFSREVIRTVSKGTQHGVVQTCRACRQPCSRRSVCQNRGCHGLVGGK